MRDCWKTEPRDRMRFVDVLERLEKAQEKPRCGQMMGSLPRPPQGPIVIRGPDALDPDGYLLPSPAALREYLQPLPTWVPVYIWVGDDPLKNRRKLTDELQCAPRTWWFFSKISWSFNRPAELDLEGRFLLILVGNVRVTNEILKTSRVLVICEQCNGKFRMNACFEVFEWRERGRKGRLVQWIFIARNCTSTRRF